MSSNHVTCYEWDGKKLRAREQLCDQCPIRAAEVKCHKKSDNVQCEGRHHTAENRKPTAFQKAINPNEKDDGEKATMSQYDSGSIIVIAQWDVYHEKPLSNWCHSCE